MADNINGNELKVGDIFFVKIYDIYAMVIDLNIESYNLAEFKLTFSEINVNVRDFQDSREYYNSITMLKYIGDNKFIEYYTNKIISKKEIDNYVYDNQFEFLQVFNRYINIPLLINNQYLIPLNTEYYIKNLEQIANQDVEKIGDIIESLEIKSRDNLTTSLEQMKQRDEVLAYAENCLYEFASREVPKL